MSHLPRLGGIPGIRYALLAVSALCAIVGVFLAYPANTAQSKTTVEITSYTHNKVELKDSEQAAKAFKNDQRLPILPFKHFSPSLVNGGVQYVPTRNGVRFVYAAVVQPNCTANVTLSAPQNLDGGRFVIEVMAPNLLVVTFALPSISGSSTQAVTCLQYGLNPTWTTVLSQYAGDFEEAEMPITYAGIWPKN